MERAAFTPSIALTATVCPMLMPGPKFVEVMPLGAMACNMAEHVFVEPFVRHDQVAVVGTRSPTVFHHPLFRLAVGIQIYRHQCHGMGRAAGECLDALFLVHTESRAHQRAVVIIVELLAVSFLMELAFTAFRMALWASSCE